MIKKKKAGLTRQQQNRPHAYDYTEAEHFFNISFVGSLELSNIHIVIGERLRVKLSWKQKWELEAILDEKKSSLLI